MDSASTTFDRGPEPADVEGFNLDVGATMDTEMDEFDFQLDGTFVDEQAPASLGEDFNSINHKSFQDNLQQDDDLNVVSADVHVLGDLGGVPDATHDSGEANSGHAPPDVLEVQTAEELEIGYDDEGDGHEVETQEPNGDAPPLNNSSHQEPVGSTPADDEDEISYDDDAPAMPNGTAEDDHQQSHDAAPLGEVPEQDHDIHITGQDSHSREELGVPANEEHRDVSVADKTVGLGGEASFAEDANGPQAFDFGDLANGEDVNETAPEEANNHHDTSLDPEEDTPSQDVASSAGNPEIQVLYGDEQYALVGAATDDEDSFFFADETQLDTPLSSFLSSLRAVIVDDISSDDELRIEVDQMSLEFGERSNEQFLRRSFREILDCFNVLAAQQEHTPDSLVLRLCVLRDSEKRFAELLAEARGEGTDHGSHHSSESQSQAPQDEQHDDDTRQEEYEESLQAGEQDHEQDEWAEHSPHDAPSNGVSDDNMEEHNDLVAEPVQPHDQNQGFHRAGEDGSAPGDRDPAEAEQEAGVQGARGEEAFGEFALGHDLNGAGDEHLDDLENLVDIDFELGPSANQPDSAALGSTTDGHALPSGDGEHGQEAVNVDVDGQGDTRTGDQVDTANGHTDPSYVLQGDDEAWTGEEGQETFSGDPTVPAATEDGPSQDPADLSGLSGGATDKVTPFSPDGAGMHDGPSNHTSETATITGDEIDYEDHDDAAPAQSSNNLDGDTHEQGGLDGLGTDNVEIDWGNDEEPGPSAAVDGTDLMTPMSASGKRPRQTDDDEGLGEEIDNKRRRT